MEQATRRDRIRREMPGDFRELAAVYTYAQLVEHYGCGKGVLARWKAEAGIEVKASLSHRLSDDQRRPMPDGFPEMAMKHSNAELRQMYRCSGLTLRRWRAASGTTGLRRGSLGRDAMPVPGDFAAVAPTLYAGQLKSHYSVGEKTIRRWVREAGVTVKQPKRAGAGMALTSQAAPIPMRDDSHAGRAAEHLRRIFAPVCRLTTLKPSADKDLWVVGRLTLTTEELIAKAEARGWSPRAWAMAA